MGFGPSLKLFGLLLVKLNKENVPKGSIIIVL